MEIDIVEHIISKGEGLTVEFKKLTVLFLQMLMKLL